MPRAEYELMTGWEFSLNSCENGDFSPVELPHDWALDMPFDKNMEYGGSQGFRIRSSVGWYRKEHSLPEKQACYRYYLDFGGIYENSTVWVNGKAAGGRKYGYSSFRLDITDFVVSGPNLILVKVDNTQQPADRWYSGCGIYRTVKWIETEERCFDENEVIVTSSIHGQQAVIHVETGRSGEVQGELKDGMGSVCAQSSSGILEFTVNGPKLWSAAEPNLYQLTLRLMDGIRAADEISMRIGIREVELRPGKGLYINGQREIWKGVCLHQDVACVGIAVRPELWRQRLQNLKDLGCNAIRCAHHTFAREFLDLCDEMGFYVYEECFDKWTGGMYGRYFETEWERDVEAMVKRDRNRACVLIWGVGNEVENQAQPSMLQILKMLTDKVRSLDAARPVTYAMNPHFKRESVVDMRTVKDIQQFVDEVSDNEIYELSERVERIARIAEYVDLISCNYQDQWYGEIHAKCPDKLILGTETYQFFNGDTDQIQNFSLENPQLTPLERPYVIGSTIWTGIDYLGESVGWPAKGWSGAMIRTNNQRRPSAYIMQSYWSERPMVHFSVMDYSLEDEGVKEHWDTPILADHWHFPQFCRTVIPYSIATNCEKVRLYLNGKEYVLQDSAVQPNRMITGFLPWMRGEVIVIGYIKGREVCRHMVRTPDCAARLQFDREVCSVPAKRGYQILLTVRAVDREGIPCFRESARVRFDLEGPAAVKAVDNGDLMSGGSYRENTVHLHHGTASVLIAIGGQMGRVKVNAYAEGMFAGTCTVITEEPSCAMK